MRSITLATFLFGSALPCCAQDKFSGFDSPEKAFQAYLIGGVTQDFDLTLSSLTPEAKAYHIGLAVFSAQFNFDNDTEMKKVFREHGVELSPSDRKVKEETDPKEAGKEFVNKMLKIKNPAKLMRQIVDRYEKLAKQLVDPNDAQPKSKPPTTKELLSSVKLGKVASTGDSAEATITVATSAKDLLRMPEKIEFRRINDRWYCHVDPR